MSVTGDSHLDSFDDVEEEFEAVRGEIHAVRVSRANDVGELLEKIGALAREVSGARTEIREVKRAIVDGFVPARATDDTGSHNLRETYHKLQILADDPDSPLDRAGVKHIVEDVTELMNLRAEVGSWRRIKAFPAWAARKALEKGLEWAIVAGLVATVTYLWTLLHR